VRRDEQIAVLCLDLDHFKDINDTLGHPIGDDLLKAVAERLGRAIRETDILARLGGDEFAIVQVEANDQPAQSAALASRLVDVISAPYDINGHHVVIGTSIGVSTAPTDGTEPDQLLKNADMALYRPKADGRGTYRFFEADMDARAQSRRALELDLRAAVACGQFELYYQPIQTIGAGEIIAFEALVRWNHPTRGMIQPNDFIPLAEQTGLIVPIGDWVLRAACLEAGSWSQKIRVAVNLSAVQFKNRKLVESVEAALSASGLAPDRLELEITETILLHDYEGTLATLRALRNLGVRISMDDFGTGYSSLSYLQSFPFDKIKIDQSFIRELANRDESMAIVRAIAGLGKSLGIPTTAEGVETREQLRLLRSEGCTEVQGYLFSPPCPAAEVETLLLRNTVRRAIA
jgi:diguanylate cyclase (GGDEF)-like protein